MSFRERANAAASVLEGVAFVPPDMDFLWGDDDQIASRAAQTATVAGDAGMPAYTSKFQPAWSQAGFATRKTYEVWRDALSRRQTANARPAASPMQEAQRGFGGNVSPRVVGSQISRMTAAKPSPLSKLDFNGVAGVASALGDRAPAADSDCVERPTGDTHGPGKYRGQWFNWCRD